MARRKRSERLAGEGRVVSPAERPRAKAEPTVAGEVLHALCPVCGRGITDRAVRIGGVTVGKTPYFDTIDWDPDKPFGVALSASGKGSFKDWRYIGPEEAPELFEQLKGRLLEAIKEWKDKGWIKSEEV